jgi:hypothetical protein
MDVVFLREKYSRGGPHYDILLKKTKARNCTEEKEQQK